MTKRPADFICTACNALVVPWLHPFRDRWFPSSCPACAAREHVESERRALLANIDEQLSGIDTILLRCGVGLRHVPSKLSDFGAAYRTLHAVDSGAFVYGPRGTGKTHLMAAIMRATILEHLLTARAKEKHPHPHLYPRMVTTSDLLREIRATFSSHLSGAESDSDVIERYGTYPVLILDDLGTEQVTDWVLATLYLIIDRRYRDMRRTFVTSNLSLAGLSAQLSDRITSRLAEMCRVVHLAGADRRLTKGK